MMSLIDADRRVLRLPVGIDAHAREHAVAHLPEDPEAVPLAVRRHVRVQPAQTGRDRVVVVGGRAEPRRRALEHEQLADVGRDLGDELHRARAGADHRDALARAGRRRGPSAPSGTTGPRTSRGPAMSGNERPVELADRADRPRSPRCVSSCAVGVAHVHRPAPRRRRTTSPTAPRCRTGCGRGGRTRRRSGGSSRAARPGSRSAAASRGAARTSSCSCGSGCRRGSPDSCSRATCRRRRRSSRRSTNGDAGLLQPVRGEQARHARADDRRTWKSTSGATSALRHAGARRSSPRNASSSSSSGRYAAMSAAADRELHDPQERRRRTAAARAGSRRRGTGSSASSASSRASACCVVGEPALGHAEQQRVGPQVVAQQRQVAGEVGERRQQRRDLGVLESGADLVVGLGDRLDRADERAAT